MPGLQVQWMAFQTRFAEHKAADRTYIPPLDALIEDIENHIANNQDGNNSSQVQHSLTQLRQRSTTPLPRPVVPGTQGICRSWLQGRCTRYENGNCSYQHPEDKKGANVTDKGYTKGKGESKGKSKSRSPSTRISSTTRAACTTMSPAPPLAATP